MVIIFYLCARSANFLGVLRSQGARPSVAAGGGEVAATPMLRARLHPPRPRPSRLPLGSRGAFGCRLVAPVAVSAWIGKATLSW